MKYLSVWVVVIWAMAMTIGILYVKLSRTDSVNLCQSKHNGDFETCHLNRDGLYLTHGDCIRQATNICHREIHRDSYALTPQKLHHSCVDPNEQVSFITCTPEGARTIWYGRQENFIPY